MSKIRILPIILSISIFSIYAQDESEMTTFKNLVSTNSTYLLINSFELNYEHTLGRKFAAGLGWASYGQGYYDLELESEDENYATQFEITPYGRLYFNGNQNRSHILEVFASLNKSERSDSFIRNTTNEGFGVYERGIETNLNFGMGLGYGYRFLFLEERLVIEAQIALRTNFNFFYGILIPSVVRSGVRIGYRF